MASLGTCEVEGRRTRNRVGELVEKQLGEGRLVDDRLLGRDALGRRSELGRAREVCVERSAGQSLGGPNRNHLGKEVVERKSCEGILGARVW